MNLQKTLKKYGITSLWHFTDKSNLKSIKKNGLLSLQMLEEKNINSCYGAESLSHSLDKSLGLDKYVHIAFLSDHPMAYIAKNRGSINHLVWIEIDIKILLKDGVLFCDKVANSLSSHLFDRNEVTKNIDFDAMFSKEFETKKEARKAEILIPNKIDAKYIINIKE